MPTLQRKSRRSVLDEGRYRHQRRGVGSLQKQRPGSRPSRSGRTPGMGWVISAEILAEYREVLARPKFGLPPMLLRQWITFLETATVLVEMPTGLVYPPDPN